MRRTPRRNEMIGSILAGGLAAVLAWAPLDAARAQEEQEAPQFMRDVWPEAGIDAAWQEFQAVMDPDGALDAMTKELVGLAVAAQVPCDYCVYYHTQAAKAHGASEEQIKEALASGALVRKWSTMLNGSQYDNAEWREQVDAMFASQ